MADSLNLTIDGQAREVEQGTTGLDLFKDQKTTVVMRVNGELWDLHREVPAEAVIESVDISSPDGLNVLRHSTAHVMAQAVQELYPEANLGIGPTSPTASTSTSTSMNPSPRKTSRQSRSACCAS